MVSEIRIRGALRAATVHFGISLMVVACAAFLVFGIWYPFPYQELSGGRELFILVVVVDVVCGPMLTLVLYHPDKPKAELWRDLGVVFLIQLAALTYGLSVMWQARPLFLVLEVDRFKVINLLDLDAAKINTLPAELKPEWTRGPSIVAIRAPQDSEERSRVTLEAAQGGRDYGERVEFYLPYEGNTRLKSLQRAKPLAVFLQKQPVQERTAHQLVAARRLIFSQTWYLPVVGRKDWVAVLDGSGEIQGFLEGDGF